MYTSFFINFEIFVFVENALLKYMQRSMLDVAAHSAKMHSERCKDKIESWDWNGGIIAHIFTEFISKLLTMNSWTRRP